MVFADEPDVQSLRRTSCRISFWRFYMRGMQGKNFKVFQILYLHDLID